MEIYKISKCIEVKFFKLFVSSLNSAGFSYVRSPRESGLF